MLSSQQNPGNAVQSAESTKFCPVSMPDVIAPAVQGVLLGDIHMAAERVHRLHGSLCHLWICHRPQDVHQEQLGSSGMPSFRHVGRDQSCALGTCYICAAKQINIMPNLHKNTVEIFACLVCHPAVELTFQLLFADLPLTHAAHFMLYVRTELCEQSCSAAMDCVCGSVPCFKPLYSYVTFCSLSCSIR